MRNNDKILVGNPQGKKPSVNFKCKLQGNINMNAKKYGVVLCRKLEWPNLGTNIRLLLSR